MQQHVVIYTPAENFWYNDPLGSKLAVGFFLFIISAFIAWAISQAFPATRNRTENFKNTFAIVLTPFIYVAIYKLLF